MKKCPFCAEEIQDEAIFCRYCQHDLKNIKTSFDVDKNNDDLHFLEDTKKYLNNGFWWIWFIQYIFIGLAFIVGGVVQEVAKTQTLVFPTSSWITNSIFIACLVLRLVICYRSFQVATKLRYSEVGAFFITIFSMITPLYAYILELISINKKINLTKKIDFKLPPEKDYKISTFIFKTFFWLLVLIGLFILSTSSSNDLLNHRMIDIKSSITGTSTNTPTLQKPISTQKPDPTITQPAKKMVAITNNNIPNIGILFSIPNDISKDDNRWLGYSSPEDTFLSTDSNIFMWTSSFNGILGSVCFWGNADNPLCKQINNASNFDLKDFQLVTFTKDFKEYSGVLKNNVFMVYDGLEQSGSPLATYARSKTAVGWIPVRFSYFPESKKSIVHLLNPTAKQEAVFLFDENESGLSLVPYLPTLQTKDYTTPSELMIGVSKIEEKIIQYDNNGNALIIDMINGKTIEKFVIKDKNENILPYIVDFPDGKIGVIKIRFDNNKASEVHLLFRDDLVTNVINDIKLDLSNEQVGDFYGINYKVSPDGNLLAVSDASTQEIYFFNAKNGASVTSKKVSSSPLNIAFAKDGMRVFISFFSGEIQLWGVLE